VVHRNEEISTVSKEAASRIEKAVILSKRFTRSKLVELMKEASNNQIGLFSSYAGIDLDRVFEQALRGASVAEELKAARDFLEEHRRRQIEVIDFFSESYPSKLRQIDDAPFLIYVKGNVAALKSKCVAVVGTRGASSFGKHVSFTYARELSADGLCVVSGLAVGIDTAAHRGALLGRGGTIAILPSTPDKIYPAENADLANEIISKGGALMAEHPLGFPIYRREFVKRNRLQSGMSLCSIIVESNPKSGSAHQAAFSFKQGRKIFVVLPDEITDANSDFMLAGADYFSMKYGATVVRFGDGLAAIRSHLAKAG
jgi:DNA protecting protein DprA